MEVEPEAFTNAKAAPVAPKTVPDPATPIVPEGIPSTESASAVQGPSISPEQPDFTRWSLSPQAELEEASPESPVGAPLVHVAHKPPSMPRDILGDLSKAFENAAGQY